jgi:hypothetical protein
MDEKPKKPYLFQPGQSGNPKGPPKGYERGRVRLLALFDKAAIKYGPQFMERLFEDGLKHPINFAHKVWIPLIQKQCVIQVEGEDGKKVAWRCLTEIGMSEEQALALTGKVIEADYKESGKAKKGNEAQDDAQLQTP